MESRLDDYMNVESKARQSKGMSNNAIYHIVTKSIAAKHLKGRILLDVGCGSGNLWAFVCKKFDRYIGVDIVQYEGFPKEAEFISCNLESYKIPLIDSLADVVCSIETIEHLENPRAFMRELVRLTKPGGWILVTTPNQLSLLSKLTFLLKNQFNAFQEKTGLYPTHITALLEIDLVRMATECGLVHIQIDYSHEGRIPFASWHWPNKLGFYGQAFSDNVCLVARKGFSNDI